MLGLRDRAASPGVGVGPADHSSCSAVAAMVDMRPSHTYRSPLPWATPRASCSITRRVHSAGAPGPAPGSLNRSMERNLGHAVGLAQIGMLATGARLSTRPPSTWPPARSG